MRGELGLARKGKNRGESNTLWILNIDLDYFFYHSESGEYIVTLINDIEIELGL